MRFSPASLRAYVSHPDPVTEVGNLVAVVIGGDAPFYPLYAGIAAGDAAWPASITLVLMPVFLIIPWVSRPAPVLARVLMAVFGTINTLDCVDTLGEASGVALFFIPCIMLGPLLFHPGERVWRVAMTGLPMLIFWLAHGRLGASAHPLSPDQNASLLALNMASVASLVAFLAFVLGNAQRKAGAGAASRPPAHSQCGQAVQGGAGFAPPGLPSPKRLGARQ